VPQEANCKDVCFLTVRILHSLSLLGLEEVSDCQEGEKQRGEMHTYARRSERGTANQRAPTCHYALQCVAVCCNALQCVAVCCSVLQ